MNSTTVAYDVKSWPNSVAAILMALSSSLGIFLNSSIIFNYFSNKNQKTAFHMICLFRAFNNLYILLVVMIGVFIPVSILGYSFYPPLMESILITSGVNLLVYNEFQSIYTAVNRLIAIFFPVKYGSMFGMKSTIFFHILYYCDRVRNLTMEHIYRYKESKFMLFSPEDLSYGGGIVAPDGMFIWAICLVVFPFVINAITFIRFYYMKKKANRQSEYLKKASEQNMIQFFQTVLQDSLFSISVIFSFKLNSLIDHRFWIFFTKTYVWQIIHVLDGFIMKVFINKISFLKKKTVGKVSPIETVARGVENVTPTVAVPHVVDS